MTSHDPDAYLDAIKDDGFVKATKETLAQVIENTTTIEEVETKLAQVRTELDGVLTLLGKRLDKLEKGPK